MGFCSYSKEFSSSSYTNIENQFICKYMALADGDAVKVYLYGLFVCQNVQEDFSVKEAAQELNMSEKQIIDYFKFWEEFDLLQIVSTDPFCVKYFPADFSKGKAKKIKPEKYTDFNKALQSMMPSRMISTSEYEKYFAVMEQFSIKPEAMILIVKYCVDLKGEKISQNYILQVAKNFAHESITTVDKIEKKLSDYVIRSGDIYKILRALNSNKKPEPDDYELLKRWTNELMFEVETIEFVASLYKKSSMQKLDEILKELYSNKKFDKAEIQEFLLRKTQIKNLTISIAKELGVYCAVIDTYVDNFVSVWLTYGYDDASLINLAKYCFKREKKSFEKMDELIKKLYSLGVISSDSIVIYMQNEAQEQTFLSEVLKTCGLTRRVNNWDKECLKNWRSWNFSDEMILKAAFLSQGKASPIPYITSILSSWKSQNIFSPDAISNDNKPTNKFIENQDKNIDFRKKVQSYYFNLRERAQDKASYYLSIAKHNPDFCKNEELLRSTEIQLAKAEALGGDTVSLNEKVKNLKKQRAEILASMQLSEDKLVPQYRCKKCKDTGFDKNGNVCSCYKKFVEDASDAKKLETILDAYSNIDL